MALRPLLFSAGGLLLTQWVIHQIANIHAALPIPVVGDGITLVVAILLVSMTAFGGWWAWQITEPESQPQKQARRQSKAQQPTPTPRKPQRPSQRHIQLSLATINERLNQVHEEASRRSLRQQIEQISATLSRDQFRIVVMGTTSTGKTTLINTLLGQPAGTVSVTHATTTTEAEHTYRLEGIEGSLELTDTPGLQTLSAAQTAIALKCAEQADLVIFTVANDLDAAEYAALQALTPKRVIVALNKSDWYLPADLETLHACLQDRCQALVNTDVVAIAAAPLDAQPQTLALTQRLSQILTTEGRQLRLANALAQTETLHLAVEQAIATKQQQDALAVVGRMQWATAGAVAVTPLPLLDLVAAAAINARMIVEIHDAYGRPLSLSQAQQIAQTLVEMLVKLGAIEVATQAAGAVLKTSPFAAVGVPLQAASAAYLTRIAGYSYCDWLVADGSDPTTLMDYLKNHLQKHRSFVPELVGYLAQRFRVPALG